MSKVVKHSIVIAGHRTSVSIEESFWSALKEIARTRRTTLSELVHVIDDTRKDRGASNLSRAIRLFVLDCYRQEVQVESPAPKLQVPSAGAARTKVTNQSRRRTCGSAMIASDKYSPMFEAYDYLDHARMFREAALQFENVRNGHPYWPKYALITHALELAIKAYLIAKGIERNPKHDLAALYEKAVGAGLIRSNCVASTDLQYLNELHKDHYARYPKNEARKIALISQYDDLVYELIASVERALRLP